MPSVGLKSLLYHARSSTGHPLIQTVGTVLGRGHVRKDIGIDIGTGSGS